MFLSGEYEHGCRLDEMDEARQDLTRLIYKRGVDNQAAICARRVTSRWKNKRSRWAVYSFTCKVLFCTTRFTRADEEARNVSQASVPYAPLYDHPTFLSALAHFRNAERRSFEATDLFIRGAKRVIYNVSLFDDEVTTDDAPAAL